MLILYQQRQRTARGCHGLVCDWMIGSCCAGHAGLTDPTYISYVRSRLLSRSLSHPGNPETQSKSVVLLCQIHTGSKRYGLAMRWPLWRIATRIRYSDLIIMRAISRNASPSKMQEGDASDHSFAYINTPSSRPHRRNNNSPVGLPSIHLLYCATKSISHRPIAFFNLRVAT